MPTDLIDKPRRHPNPSCHPLKDRGNAPGIHRTTDLLLSNQPTKYRSLVYLRVLHPHLEPLHRLSREIGHPTLPFRIGLATANQRLAGAVGTEIDVANFQCHELAPPSECFISDAQHGSFTVCAQPLAGAVDELF